MTSIGRGPVRSFIKSTETMTNPQMDENFMQTGKISQEELNLEYSKLSVRLLIKGKRIDSLKRLLGKQNLREELKIMICSFFIEEKVERTIELVEAQLLSMIDKHGMRSLPKNFADNKTENEKNIIIEAEKLRFEDPDLGK